MILVFKTNIDQKDDVMKLSLFLNNQNNIRTWNVDIEDKDKVLRIETFDNITNQVEDIVREAGYWCDELE